MEFFSALDVSMERTAICVVDDKGELQMQTEVVTDPDAIAAVLKPFLPRLRRAGHEAGSLSPWLQPELIKCGLPAVCLETTHVRAAMSGSATRRMRRMRSAWRISCAGWFRRAHFKTESCYRLRDPHQRHRAHRPRQSGVRGGGQRCADQRADGRHTGGAGRAVEAILPAARPPGGEVRRLPRAVPSLHGDPRRWAGDGVDLRDGD